MFPIIIIIILCKKIDDVAVVLVDIGGNNIIVGDALPGDRWQFH